MSLAAIIHGIRVGWQHFRCTHPAVVHATITVIGEYRDTPVWWCTDCHQTFEVTG